MGMNTSTHDVEESVLHDVAGVSRARVAEQLRDELRVGRVLRARQRQRGQQYYCGLHAV